MKIFRFPTFIALSIPLLVLPNLFAQAALERTALMSLSSADKILDTTRALLHNENASADDYLDAAAALEQLGRLSEALKALEKGFGLFPSDARLASALGWAYYYHGEISQSIEIFGKAADLGSKDDMDLLGLSLAAQENNMPDRALEHLKALATKRPHIAIVQFYLGKVYAALGKTSDAIAAYKEAIRLDSYLIEARLPLADVYKSTGQIDEAWKQCTRLLTVNGSYKQALQMRSGLSAQLKREASGILSPHRIDKQIPVEPAQDAKKITTIIRIGIGAGDNGKPTRMKIVNFRASQPFQIMTPSKFILAVGGANEPWSIQLASGRAKILNPEGKTIGTYRGSAFLQLEDPAHGTVIINSVKFVPGSSWEGMSDKELRGKVEISLNDAHTSLRIVNHVNLEEYLYGVVAAEMPIQWPAEAIKSQAVIARTFAVYLQKTLRLHRKYGYDLCDGEHCQMYNGVEAESAKALSAVNDTRGQILTHDGGVVHAVYSSNCGGFSVSGKELGWGDVSYWQAAIDAPAGAAFPETPWQLEKWLQTEPAIYCNAVKYVWAPEIRWIRVIRPEDIETRLRRRKRLGRVTSVIPLKRSRSGHVLRLKIVGTQGEITLKKEHQIRGMLGIGPLRSNLFIVKTTVRDGKTVSFTLFGGGWGHGVGLCQSGAAGRADAGASYSEILSHYFKDTELHSLKYAE